MNFSSHGSSDLYPTFTSTQLGFSNNAKTVTQVIANLGAVTGGIFFGYVSNTWGRRFSLLLTCVVAAACLYPYTYLRDKKIMAAAFFDAELSASSARVSIPVNVRANDAAAARTDSLMSSSTLKHAFQIRSRYCSYCEQKSAFLILSQPLFHYSLCRSSVLAPGQQWPHSTPALPSIRAPESAQANHP